MLVKINTATDPVLHLKADRIDTLDEVLGNVALGNRLVVETRYVLGTA